MSRQTTSSVVMACAMLLFALAVATLMPGSPKKLVSDLGYHTLCPFAPYSTLTLLFFAGLGWAVHQHMQKQP